ncbi:kinase-like domain-containing protein, partial [Crepidotus variabilis]
LKSAYRPSATPATQQFSRHVPLEKCNFHRFNLAGNPLSQAAYFEQSKTREVIKIANKSTWTNAILDSSGATSGRNVDENGSGFIGQGSTNVRFMYARFDDIEYAVTFPFDSSMSAGDVQDMLEAEFRLLALCNALQKEFNNMALSSDVNGAILGQLIPSPVTDEIPLPYVFFLATPLLPVGQLYGTLRKFTGNGEIGKADNDITKTVHAFAHFSLLYSDHEVLICDLQGLKDKHGVWCLFDPQVHTNRMPRLRVAYWDRGLVEIQRFEQQHEVDCLTNWVCNKLRLRSVTFDHEPDSRAESSPEKSPPRKAFDLRNLLNAASPAPET